MATHGYTCVTPFFGGLHMAKHGYTRVTPFFWGLHMATHGYTMLHMATHGYTWLHIHYTSEKFSVWPEVLPLSGRDGGSCASIFLRYIILYLHILQPLTNLRVAEL